MSRQRHALALTAFAITAIACAKKEIPIVEVKGECADVYQGQVCTWARMQGAMLVEVGATVPVSTIENAPKEDAMTWPPTAAAILKLPEAARAQSGLTDFTVYWEAMGHPPGAYLIPHWDFHFYTVPAAERMAIDCKDLAKPATLPTGYELPNVPLPPPMAKAIGVPVLVGLCVPQMGMHAVLSSEITTTNPFSGSMVIGYFGGKPIFIEPMLTKAMLMEKKSFTFPIPAIPGMAGVHPNTFRADFDPQTQGYRFVYSGFAPGA